MNKPRADLITALLPYLASPPRRPTIRGVVVSAPDRGRPVWVTRKAWAMRRGA